MTYAGGTFAGHASGVDAKNYPPLAVLPKLEPVSFHEAQGPPVGWMYEISPAEMQNSFYG
ncbi:MAG: hypothetical protein BTN85_1439 [Candidatus Methanohalarchaeum thermophilum]|uniref:Uncharacterized protein n=1 Tax=Methanohalarchaeum thermophilum TaxID=1903181 RepID=A0A1Q6DX41_METT1|nr:MAG: hypothetical protein BTN85_1439 [Candidatus Methanohalarchaeum thermophilum]